METSLPTPMTARVYVNLPEGIYIHPHTPLWLKDAEGPKYVAVISKELAR